MLLAPEYPPPSKLNTSSEKTMSLYNCMKELINQDLLDPTATGIARKIKADGSINKLSDKQHYHYEHKIKKLVEISCANFDCHNDASLSNVAAAHYITEDFETISAYCEHCEYINEQNAKND